MISSRRLRLFPLNAFLSALMLCPAPLRGENPDYQRYDLKRESSELTLEGSFRYWTQETNEHDTHTLRFGAKAEFAFKTNHSVTLSLPYTLSAYNNPDARQTLFYSFGDISAGYEYLKQFGHINLFAGPTVTIPLTETNEYALREGVFSAGEGRYTAGANVSVTGIRDPVVWNIGFQYLVGLPKKERFYTSWEPGNMQVSAGFSHLINYRFGFSAGLTQRLSLPAIQGDHFDPAGVSVSTATKGEFLILFEKNYVQVSVETTLYPLNQPFIIGLVYGHKFELSPKKNAKEPAPSATPL